MKSKQFIAAHITGGIAVLAEMKGVMTDSGYLEHYIDGDLRAVVPPEGQPVYCEQWPQLSELCVAAIAEDHA